MKLWAVEGNRFRLDGGSMFGNAPRELWKKWAHPDEKNRIDLACRCLLIENDKGQHILFETGIGSYFDPKLKDRYGVYEEEHMLLKNLDKLGIHEKDIDAIILSHLHFDHAGGLLSTFGHGHLRLLFPNAKYYVGREHWERACNPHAREQASFILPLQSMLEETGRLRLINKPLFDEYDLDITFTFSDGHTIGLMISEIKLFFGSLYFVSDLMPGVAWVHPPIAMGYDRFPERTIEEKTALLEKIVEKKGKVFFTHDPLVEAADILLDDAGRYYAKPFKVG